MLATVFLPQESAVFYPDGNSPGNTMENSGKQNPESGFKSPQSRYIYLIINDLQKFAISHILSFWQFSAEFWLSTHRCHNGCGGVRAFKIAKSNARQQNPRVIFAR